MRRGRSSALSVISVAGLVGASGFLAALNGPPSDTRDAPAASVGDRHVTLVTGDRVSVSTDTGRVRINPAPGREGVRFAADRVDGRVNVVPEDVRGLVAAGRLDRSLFDVTAMTDAGYDDASRTDLPVRLPGGAAAAVAKSTAAASWPRLASSLTGGPGAALRLDVPQPPEAGSPAPTHTLTVRHIGRDGRPATDAEAQVLGLDAELREYLTVRDGVATAELPAGRYTLVGDVIDAQSNWHRLVQPTLTLHSDLTVTVDARRTRPVTTTVQRRDARPALVDLGFDRHYGDGKVHSLSLTSSTFGKLFTAQLGPSVGADEMTSGISSTWGRPGPRGDFRNTPYTYNLLNTRGGGFFTGFDRDVSDRDLAQLTSRHLTQGPGRQGTKGWYGLATGYAAVSGALLPYDLPATVTHLLDTRDTQWSGSFGEQITLNGEHVYSTAMGSDYRAFAAGRHYTDRWNAGVFGPYLFRPDHAAVHGDRLWFGAPLFTDQENHRAGSRSDRASTEVFRDGRSLGGSAGGQLTVTVPPGRAAYRVHNVSERASMFPMSSKVDVTWSFTAEAGSAAPVPLPLWVVRYFPAVDETNRLPGSGVLRVPVSVESQPEAEVGAPARLTVDVSADGGATWQPARVSSGGPRGYVAEISRPAGADSLALRARFADDRGNAVDQTIHDALRFHG
ncbi:peptidase S8 [Actinoplanes sp. ATCC 53533]|uniref:peptidase S8 n=1 Tax=Actinoplanes sp. ATCC 53533 TaxID=1288362 RepID=UPI000F7AA210|nr:peptidase S8 [Actinoplanes sp. ATCC 53533]RSM47485.1 peptidase S8 [Actinoplanes sp. ATCC 53533]